MLQGLGLHLAASKSSVGGASKASGPKAGLGSGCFLVPCWGLYINMI